jgi:hypothetical protein
MVVVVSGSVADHAPRERVRSLCRVPDAGGARRSHGQQRRRPEAAKERTRGLFWELLPRAMGFNRVDQLTGRVQCAVI